MVGITSYGAYVPAHRLSLGALGGRTPREAGPEKAVAWADEDAITMAVEAGACCLRGVDRARVDALYFASTSHPFREKQGAALIARALDLRRDLRTADHASSLRAGTDALRAAVDAVAAGSARCVLVVASDCRLGAPGSALERNGGDGAAAFLVAEGEVVASLDASHAVADEIVDVWRTDGEAFVHSWEDRFVVQEGYTPRVVEAVAGLLERTGTHVGDYARVLLTGPDARSHGSAARALRIASEQLGDPLFGRLGSAGAAFAPLQLAAALETARVGDRLLLASHGDGAEAHAFRVTEHLEKLGPRRGVTWHLERRRPVKSYDAYLKSRGMVTAEWEAPPGPGLSATIHFRERDSNLSFLGQQCNACGAVQFPSQRVCESCFARDDFSLLRLSDRRGRLVTYTFDFFFPTPEPPTVVGIIDVEGARMHMQVANCRPEEVSLGMPVEFQFRRIHEAGGRPNYYWKAVPAGETEDA